MTRFARAKGSKASNERVPEEATSWVEMKQQLLDKNKDIEVKRKKQEVNELRNANYKAFLEEKEESEFKNSSWAVFHENIKTMKQSSQKSVGKNKKHKNREDFEECDENSSDQEFTLLKSKVDQVLLEMGSNKNLEEKSNIESVKQNKRKRKLAELTKTEGKTSESYSDNGEELLPIQQQIVNKNTVDSDSEGPPEEESSKNEVIKPNTKIKKSGHKAKIVIDNDGIAKTVDKKNNKVVLKKKATEGKEIVKKKLKNEYLTNKLKNVNGKDAVKEVAILKKKSNENLTKKDLIKIEKKKQKRLKQVLKKKKLKEELKKQKEESEGRNNNNNDISDNAGKQTVNLRENNGKDQYRSEKFEVSNNNIKMRNKEAKLRDKEEHSRKKPLLPHKMFINGKEVEIEYVDGFPVKKEDAERLKKLRKEMISKGLPRSEIKIALKLERRKAEKAFAREKKKVCFNCRKSGHNLSECPDLNKNQVAQTSGSGICFKCGSTEHTHFECKVVRSQEFKFAQCFICNEQGHIARQCPDNARGLYPKGGACRVCGDVTHLKKDCPKYQAHQQMEENNLKIETLGESNPDVLEDVGQYNRNVNKRPNKIIKF